MEKKLNIVLLSRIPELTDNEKYVISSILESVFDAGIAGYCNLGYKIQEYNFSYYIGKDDLENYKNAVKKLTDGFEIEIEKEL